MIDKKEFRSAMVLKGYSYRTLAEALGVTKDTISNKVNGKSSFTTEEAVKLCTLLEIVDPAKTNCKTLKGEKNANPDIRVLSLFRDKDGRAEKRQED